MAALLSASQIDYMNFKWDFGAVFFLAKGLGVGLPFGPCIWRCPVLNVVIIERRSCEVGSGISLVPSETGLPTTTPP